MGAARPPRRLDGPQRVLVHLPPQQDELAEDGRTCFSTEAPPKCAIGCKPVDVIDKKLAFHCPTERNVIDHLKQEMTFRPLDEVNGKEISFVQTFSVPAACIPA